MSESKTPGMPSLLQRCNFKRMPDAHGQHQEITEMIKVNLLCNVCYILVLAKFLFHLVAGTIAVMLTAISSPLPEEPLDTVCIGKKKKAFAASWRTSISCIIISEYIIEFNCITSSK